MLTLSNYCLGTCQKSKVFNDYYLRHIDEEQLHTCVLTWVDNCPNKLFKDNDINPTVKAVIGKIESLY